MQLNLRRGSVIHAVAGRWLIKTAITGPGQDAPSRVLWDTHGRRSREGTQALRSYPVRNVVTPLRSAPLRGQSVRRKADPIPQRVRDGPRSAGHRPKGKGKT